MKLIKDLGVISTKTTKERRRRGIYECPNCNEQNEHSTNDVNNGKIKSCITCSRKLRALKHGDSRTKLHQVWGSIKQRCNNTKNKSYPYYGGRGISLCKEWSEYQPFKEWSIVNGYKEGLTIDRINNDGDYEPANCSWVTMKEQSTNKRRSNNFISTYKGVSWKKSNNKWQCQYKGEYMGLYENEIDAANAWKDRDRRMGID